LTLSADSFAVTNSGGDLWRSAAAAINFTSSIYSPSIKYGIIQEYNSGNVADRNINSIMVAGKVIAVTGSTTFKVDGVSGVVSNTNGNLKDLIMRYVDYMGKTSMMVDVDVSLDSSGNWTATSINFHNWKVSGNIGAAAIQRTPIDNVRYVVDDDEVWIDIGDTSYNATYANIIGVADAAGLVALFDANRAVGVQTYADIVVEEGAYGFMNVKRLAVYTPAQARSGSSMQTGAIKDGEQSVITKEVEILSGADISFTWKVSSQQGSDIFNFAIYRDLNGDGIYETLIDDSDNISGETGWETVSKAIVDPGRYQLKWTYSKDGSGSAGFDAGWIDDIRAEASLHDKVYFDIDFEPGPVSSQNGLLVSDDAFIQGDIGSSDTGAAGLNGEVLEGASGNSLVINGVTYQVETGVSGMAGLAAKYAANLAAGEVTVVDIAGAVYESGIWKIKVGTGSVTLRDA
jgi:hypothetical protein